MHYLYEVWKWATYLQVALSIPFVLMAPRDWRWLWFAIVVIWIGNYADFIGLFLLLVPAIRNSWIPAQSTYWAPDAQPSGPKPIVIWRWLALNEIWGNPEDGVLGPDWHLPGRPAWWRAYAWSALRNRSDNLKYLFALPGGPWEQKDFTLFGKPLRLMAGWRNAAGLVTLSVGAP